MGRLQPIETDVYWDMFDSYFGLLDGGAKSVDVDGEGSPRSVTKTQNSRSKFDMQPWGAAEAGNVGSKRAQHSEQKTGQQTGGGGSRVARQVGELSRNFEKLSQAQQSMEAKVDALQAQQETVIQMLKKLT